MSDRRSAPVDPTPDAPVAEARPAATVVLLREGLDGVETWLLRRASAMAFAGGMSVFPGGRVDAADADATVPWWGAPPDPALRALTVAAVRETFEETAVLLTHPRAHPTVLARRADVEARAIGFAALLAGAGLSIDSALMRPWARWITPVAEPRRYDTWFFVAALPDGATAEAVSGEAVQAGWTTPDAALSEHARGTRPVLPPTLIALRELTAFARVADVLTAAAGRDLRAVLPMIDRRSGTVTLPDGAVLDLPPAP